MASEWVCPVLDAAVEKKPHRSFGDREGDQGFDPEDCVGESDLGKSSSTRGTAKTRHPHLGASCSPAYAEAEETAIADLARAPGQSS